MKVNHSFPQRVEVLNINHVSLQKNDVTFGNGGIYTIVIQPNKAIEKVWLDLNKEMMEKLEDIQREVLASKNSFLHLGHVIVVPIFRVNY